MSQEVVKKKAHPADVLTEMQRRFADYLVYNQGRTTFTDAALAAGYSPKRARVEGSELMDNPKVIKYLRYKTNEVNRSYTVTKNNYVLRQQKLSKNLEQYHLRFQKIQKKHRVLYQQALPFYFQNEI